MSQIDKREAGLVSNNLHEFMNMFKGGYYTEILNTEILDLINVRLILLTCHRLWPIAREKLGGSQVCAVMGAVLGVNLQD